MMFLTSATADPPRTSHQVQLPLECGRPQVALLVAAVLLQPARV